MREGWEIKKLGDVCHNVQYGTSKKASKEGEIPVIRMGNIQDGKINWNNLLYADEQEDIGKYSLQKDDVLFNRTNSAELVGKTAIYKGEQPAIFAGYLIRINRKINLLDGNYLNYYLNSSRTREYGFSVMSSSVNQANINGTKLKEYLIPIPLLKEQKQIVAILDKTFAVIDKAKTNVEKNLQNAKELFQSKLNEIFSQKGEGWEEKKIECLTELISKGSSPKWQGINYVEKPGILFVTSENVGDGKLLIGKKKYLEERFNEIEKKSILKKGDVLTNIVGASIGRTAIYDIEDVANINQAVCVMRCKKTELINYYLMYILNSPHFKNILHNNEVNNARANLSLTFFRNLIIPLPSIEIQKKVVYHILNFEKICSTLINNYKNKLCSLEELKKSTLQKAFAGELTTKGKKV